MMYKNIDELEFVIFDTETTGLNPASGDRIIEIAALRFKGDVRLDSFNTLVNPRRQVSPGAFAVNKISQEMLLGAPYIEDVIPQFLQFIKGSCLCSYNAPFDLGFLENELKLIQMQPISDILVVDVLCMARKLLPNLGRYPLWFVSESLGIKTAQEHRAFSDVELTFGVFQRLKGILKEKGIVDLENFSRLFSINPHVLGNSNTLKLGEIQKAIDLGAKLKIKYISSLDSSVSEREVIPQEIRQENNSSYMVGFCFLRKDRRTFRVENIVSIELLSGETKNA